MSMSIYDKQLVRWVKSHHWDSLEKDKDIILRHIRTFAGGNVEQENAEALKPSHNSDYAAALKFTVAAVLNCTPDNETVSRIVADVQRLNASHFA